MRPVHGHTGRAKAPGAGSYPEHSSQFKVSRRNHLHAASSSALSLSSGHRGRSLQAAARPQDTTGTRETTEAMENHGDQGRPQETTKTWPRRRLSWPLPAQGRHLQAPGPLGSMHENDAPSGGYGAPQGQSPEGSAVSQSHVRRPAEQGLGALEAEPSSRWDPWPVQPLVVSAAPCG